jgi:hypothetical protein
MAGRFSPIASQSARFGELGAMLLAVDVDLGGLDRGLNQARSMTAGASTDMGRNLDRFSRSSRFAFQNAAFQVQDFVVQVAAGQGALRAFALQAPQFASAFGPVGTVIGTVIALAAGLGAAFLSAGNDAEEAGGGVATLDDALKKLSASGQETERDLQNLATRFAEATSQAQEFIQVTARAGVAQARQVEAAAETEFAAAIGRLDRPRAGGGLTQEQAAGLAALAQGFGEATVGATEFQDQIEEFASQASPAAARRIREFGQAAIEAGQKSLEAGQAARQAEQELAQIQRLAEQGARIRTTEEFGPAEAENIARSTGTVAGADRDAAAAAKERTDQIVRLRDAVATLDQVQRAAIEAGFPSAAARERAAFGGRPPLPEFKPTPPAEGRDLEIGARRANRGSERATQRYRRCKHCGQRAVGYTDDPRRADV